MCRRSLTNAGYDAHLVSSGARAVAAVQRQAFDVALVDMKMPDMDGVAVLRAFREHDPDLPCVVISGVGEFSEAVECIRHGAVDFLLKPFDLETVVRAIDRADASSHLKVDSLLLAATQSIFSSLDARQIAQRVLALVKNLLSATSASITLGTVTAPIETFRINASGEDVSGPTLPTDAWRRVIEWRDPMVLNRDVASPDGELVAALAPEAHTALLQRLVFGDRVVGLLLAARGRGDRAFGERDLRRAMVLAGHVALALENARLHAETEEQAHEIERALDRLVVAERIATVGRLSSGLGHEIANPACAVLASLDVAQMALEGGKPREALDAIRHAQAGTNAVLDVCQALRPLAARSRREELVDLRRVVDGALMLATYELRPRARVITDIPPQLPLLLADPAKLGQVFLNLLLNAAQAIEPGAPERNAVTVRLEAKNHEIVAQVEDTGRGIPSKLARRLFEPSVTTKVHAEGHGMGLAICKWIVEEAGGTIRCLPDRPRGAIFEVRLPVRG